ncbi:MAG: NTP transferase domain-containing protein [Planctomycetes bacterium]|nr:NTP transferase domain-containing protein [Planctomycetota bacterium]
MLHSVIMAGGSGTRFWPESRKNRPKQLLPILGSQAMLAETVSRVKPVTPIERIWIGTNAAQIDGVRAVCPDIPDEQILIEPCARNTAACAALAAATVASVDSDATLAVLPADHAIHPDADFQRSLVAGTEAASERGTLVTFGIQPNYPATGYGYIHEGKVIEEIDGIPVHTVNAFTEKPSTSRATSFLKSGGYLWNAGIFVWRADSILDCFEKYQLEIYRAVRSIIDSGVDTTSRKDALHEIYPDLPSLPVDIAILEQHDQVRVLRAPYHWNDVGSWRALFEEIGPDRTGNVQIFPAGGSLLAEEAEGVLAYSRTKKTVAVLGLNDLVIVHTEDAILVAPRARAEEVKRFVERLQEEGNTELL